MKRKITSLLLAVFLIFSASPAVAQKNYGLDKAATQAQYEIGEGNSVYSLVQIVINAFLALIGFVFFGLLTYSGIRWMTARGNEEFVTRAKDAMSAAIWGLIVTMGAYALTTFIFNALNK